MIPASKDPLSAYARACPGRGRRFRLCLRGVAAGAFALIATVAAAQEEPPPETSGQLWANVIVGRSKSPRLYNELDLEPKTQISGGAPWYNLDATPLVEFYPHSLVPGQPLAHRVP